MKFQVYIKKTVADKACTDRWSDRSMKPQEPMIVTSLFATFLKLKFEWSNNHNSIYQFSPRQRKNQQCSLDKKSINAYAL